MKKLILICIILQAIVFAATGYAVENILVVPKGKEVTVQVEKKSTFIFSPVFVNGEKVIGKKDIVCKDVTDCTIDKEGLYAVSVSPTSLDKSVGSKGVSKDIGIVIRIKNR
jgi:hypothetical protein